MLEQTCKGGRDELGGVAIGVGTSMSAITAGEDVVGAGGVVRADKEVVRADIGEGIVDECAGIGALFEFNVDWTK